jgi:uncharacterized RDD family membrane protein YckC
MNEGVSVPFREKPMTHPDPPPLPNVQTYGSAPSASRMNHASWLQRVGATLIDGVAVLAAQFVFGLVIGMFLRPQLRIENGEVVENTLATYLLLTYAFSLLFTLYNYGYRQGNTGSTIGKSLVGLRVVGADTGQPIGFGMSVLRQICHILDGFFLLGYLWPLWDTERRTFADMIMRTRVVS